MSHFRCTKLSVQVWGCFLTQHFFTFRSFYHVVLNLKLQNALCRLSATAYSIFTTTIHSGLRSSNRNMRTRRVVETRSHLLQSMCNKCKKYKLHRITVVGLGKAVLVNEVTIVVNCYGVALCSQDCCKIDLSDLYYLEEFVGIEILGLFFVRQEEIAYCVQKLI